MVDGYCSREDDEDSPFDEDVASAGCDEEDGPASASAIGAGCS